MTTGVLALGDLSVPYCIGYTYLQIRFRIPNIHTLLHTAFCENDGNNDMQQHCTDDLTSNMNDTIWTFIAVIIHTVVGFKLGLN